MNEITPTTIVGRIETLDDDASKELMPLIYDELRRLAAESMRRRPEVQSIQPTDLVHEAFEKMIDHSVARSDDRARFMAVAARVMRDLLVDHVRRRDAKKRGGGWQRITLGGEIESSKPAELDVLALNQALKKLSVHSERMATIVDLRFFGGLTIADTATALGVGHATVENDWAFARVWLARELEGSSSESD